MSFRIANVMMSIPTVSISTQSVSTSTVSTSEITEQVAGAGIKIGDITVHGDVVYAGGVALTNSSGKKVTLTAPSVMAADVAYKMPAADGTVGQVLKTDGSGQWDWITITGGTTDFLDSEFKISNALSGSKKIMFDASSISPSTVRTIYMPDNNINLSDLSYLNQNVTSSGAPSFVSVTTNTISERTNSSGVTIKANSKKVFAANSNTQNMLTSFDVGEYVTYTEHPKTGTIAAGASLATVCMVSMGADSSCFVEITFIARDSAGAFEVFKSYKILARVGTGTVVATDYMDALKHTNWSGVVDVATYKIKNQQGGLAKSYVACLRVMPLTTSSTYTVDYYSPL